MLYFFICFVMGQIHWRLRLLWVSGMGYRLLETDAKEGRKERVNRGGPYKERARSVLHTRTRLNNVCYSEYGLN
jgi:hypothetical protein